MPATNPLEAMKKGIQYMSAVQTEDGITTIIIILINLFLLKLLLIVIILKSLLELSY